MNKIFRFYKLKFFEVQSWIFFIVALAAVWIAVGGVIVTVFPQTLPGFVNFMEENFRNSLGDIQKLSPTELARVLFVQNSRSSVLDLFFGAGLGLLPVVSIAVNFFALGFLGAAFLLPTIDSVQVNSFWLFLSAVLPHGIFELPALMLSAAFGLRLGLGWLLPSAQGKRWWMFKRSLWDNVRLAPLILILLGIAAFVESFITPNLIK